MKMRMFCLAIFCTVVSAFAQSGSELPKVAVYVAGGQDAAEHQVLSSMVLAAFVNSRKYAAIERADAFTTEIDREQTRQRSGAVDDAQISQLGKQSGVDFVCVVDVMHVLNEYQLSARLINVETASVVSMSTTDSPLKNLAELRNAANNLVGGLLGTAGRTASQMARPETAPQTSDSRLRPSSPEAFTVAASSSEPIVLKKKSYWWIWGLVTIAWFISFTALMAAAESNL